MARFIRNPIVEKALLSLKTGKDWAVAQLVIFALYLAQKLPPNRSAEFAEKSGRFLAPILPRTKLARKNLTLAFPEKSEQEIEDIVRGVWGNVGRTLAEYVFLDQLLNIDPDNLETGPVELIGVEKFLQLKSLNKPIIIFTGHIGNWEILPIAASTFSFNVTALFRPPNNKFLAKRLLNARHTENGTLVPSRAGAAWNLARVLEEDGAVGILADQAFSRGPQIEFFGRPASANPLTAKLARQFDCDIYPARCIRLPGGKFQMELMDPIDIPRTSDGSVDVIETTKEINKVIEGWIREYPEQWLWLHNRWKAKEPKPRKWES